MAIREYTAELIGSQLKCDSLEAKKETENVKPVPLFPSYRLLVVVLAMFALLCTKMSQGMPAASLLIMLQRDTDSVNGSWSLNATANEWRFTWDQSTEGWILSSYLIGYAAMQLPAGWLTNRFGEKRVVLGSAMALAALQVVAIAAARVGPGFFMATMVLTGLANGSIFIASMAIVAKWSPPQECSHLSSIAVSGLGFGMAFGYCLSAVVSKTQFMGSWPLSFIILGVMLLMLCAAWAVWVADSPGLSSRISPQEQLYIQSSFSTHGHVITASKVQGRTPWGTMLWSGPFWAVVFAQLGTDWIACCMITSLRNYFKHVRHMDIAQVGMLCGLPWAGGPVVGYLASALVDRLRARGVPTTLLRKISDFLEKPVCACLLLAMSFLPANQGPLPTAVLYTAAVLLLLGFEGSGYAANIAELTPEFAGVVWSLSQTAGTVGSFAAPLTLAALAPNNTLEEWRSCFYLTLGVATATFLVYLVWGSSRPQRWVCPESASLLSARPTSSVPD